MSMPQRWQPHLPSHGLSPALRDWLQDVESTTARLSDANGYQGKVERLFQGWANTKNGRVYQRIVALGYQQQPFMLAISQVSAASMATSHGQAFKLLNEQPLGQWLFAELGLKRQHMRYACLCEQDGLVVQCQHWLGLDAQGCWARRSDFTHQSFALQLTEVFLPHCLFG